MHLRYETGVATFAQFVIGTGLSFINGIASIIGGCHGTSGAECISNTFVSLVLIILTIGWFIFLAALGYVAQERRSSRLALTLIAVEIFSGIVFLFDTKHAPGIIERLTNLISFVVAAWVIYLAWRLYWAKGARIVTAKRRNQ